ncbi:hypothetical protein [Ornithinibacillus xuwenensis]|uniref:Uncharacterized protein n=1 Tax=Ornithinibacillus xuwenensis TaxID=3144668 RepID=A0ABU9XHV4_9BACI
MWAQRAYLHKRLEAGKSEDLSNFKVMTLEKEDYNGANYEYS